MIRAALLSVALALASFSPVGAQSLCPADATATGGGYYVVYRGETTVSQHTRLDQAMLVAMQIETADPTDDVTIVHDFRLRIECPTGVVEPLPEPEPDPTPDPDPDPNPSPVGHAHEPAGMTVTVNADGTTTDIPQLAENAGWRAYTRVVDDPGAPLGRAIEGVIEAGRPAFGIAENPSGLRPSEEWYVSYRIKYDPAHPNLPGHKLGYIGVEGSTLRLFLAREADGRFRLIRQQPTALVLAQTGPGALTVGDWHHIELLMNTATGRLSVWLDGRVIADRTVDYGAPGAFNGTYLWLQSNDAAVETRRVRIGEFYISGR